MSDEAGGLGHNGGPKLDQNSPEENLDPEAAKVLKELEGKTPEELLQEAQKALLTDLLWKLKMGQASHQELAIVRNLLRDNGIMIAPKDDITLEEDEEREPADLPQYEDPDYA